MLNHYSVINKILVHGGTGKFSDKVTKYGSFFHSQQKLSHCEYYELFLQGSMSSLGYDGAWPLRARAKPSRITISLDNILLRCFV